MFMDYVLVGDAIVHSSRRFTHTPIPGHVYTCIYLYTNEESAQQLMLIPFAVYLLALPNRRNYVQI
jgi:hypothetical protein